MTSSIDVLIDKYIRTLFNALKLCSILFKLGDNFSENVIGYPASINSIITFFLWISEYY